MIHGISQDFVRIPDGEILMGSDDRPDEQPVHKVHVASFDISATEVTVRQFRAFAQATGYITDAEEDGHSFVCCWRPKLGITWKNPGFIQSDDEPAVVISWNDAVEYCKWISDETGDDYRLPSEAEWEYVCKTGNGKYKGPFDSIAWYGKNSGGRTHLVGTRASNDLGLSDMIGNAWEWTGDVYHDSYNGAPEDGSAWMTGGSSAQRGYLKPGEGRVLRGGSWGLYETMHPVSYDLRITSRPVFGRDNSCNNSGFRLVRNIKHISDSNEVSAASDFDIYGEEYHFVRIPGGKYLMGADNSGREISPTHPVYFKKAFRIGTTEVTVGQFRGFVKSTGYLTDAEKRGYSWDSDFRSRHTSKKTKGLTWNNPGFDQSEENPVTCISWNDAMAFCKWLSKETGRIIRLPSEAEWEYAALGEKFKVSDFKYSEIAWYSENSGMTTHRVGMMKPVSDGLFDMLGNVSEWTMDIWNPDYTGAPEDGSSWLGINSTARVVRGGSFERELSEMSLKGRDWYDQSEAIVGTGFRILDAGESDQ
jgi:formylglycine-generating enzyme required for sulfatase activity